MVPGRAYRSRSVWARRGGNGGQGKQVFHGSGHVVRGLPRRLWGREAVVSVGAGSELSRWPWCRGRAYRSKSAWVSPRRLQSRDVAYRPGLALPDLLQDLTHADSEVVGPKRSTTVSRPHPCGAGSVLTKAGLLRPDEPPVSSETVETARL